MSYISAVVTPRVSFFYSRAMLNCSFTPRILATARPRRRRTCFVIIYTAGHCCWMLPILRELSFSIYRPIILLYRNSYIAHHSSVLSSVLYILYMMRLLLLLLLLGWCCAWRDSGWTAETRSYYLQMTSSMTRSTSSATTFSLEIF